MILYGKRVLSLHPDTFDAFIIQIDVAYLHLVGLPDPLRVDPETMILRSDLALVPEDILYRMVDPPVSVMRFIGANPIGQRKQLMSQADPKQRLVACNGFLDGFHRVGHGRRIARAV